MNTNAPALLFEIAEPQTFEGWQDTLTKLVTAGRRINWMIGDCLIAGLEQFGERARDEANRIARLDIDRLGPIVDTCRRFPEPTRHPLLTFGHHLAVMAVKDDSEAQRILTAAETDRMTVAAVKAHVRVSTDRQTTLLPDDDPDDREYRQMAQAWNRCSSISARQMFVEAIEEAGINGEIEL
jgi:hypothetical protein